MEPQQRIPRLVVIALLGAGAVIGGAAMEYWRSSRLPTPAAAQAGDPELERLKTLVPSQSHTMSDVGYQWTNLWFAVEQKNWPLAEFYFAESRAHIQWTIAIRPVRKDLDGKDVDLKSIFNAVDPSVFAAVKMAIAQKDGAAFESAYKQALDGGCYSCHKAREAVSPSDRAEGARTDHHRFRTGSGRASLPDLVMVTRVVNRRQFLRLSVLAGAPGLLFQQPRPSTAPVVVVGAGLAGLRAAAVLKNAGRQVIVLEARQRPGGRVLTIRAPFDEGLYAEAGPIRIAGAHAAVLRAVREFGLSLLPFESSTGARGAIGSDSSAGAGTPGLKADERGLSANALLERYVGKLPSDLTESATTAASYARWRDYDRDLASVAPFAWRFARRRQLMTLGGGSRELSALYVLRQSRSCETSASATRSRAEWICATRHGVCPGQPHPV